jgi:hypothetical protein
MAATKAETGWMLKARRFYSQTADSPGAGFLPTVAVSATLNGTSSETPWLQPMFFGPFGSFLSLDGSAGSLS